MALRIQFIRHIVCGLVWSGIAWQASAAVVSIDFANNVPFGGFNPNTFQSEGVIFTQSDNFVNGGLLQPVAGDPIFGLPMLGVFQPGVSSLSAKVTLDAQAIEDITLSAFDAQSMTIKSQTLHLNLIFTDPGYQGLNSVQLDLGTLPRPAFSFSISSAVVSSPFFGYVGFELQTITFNQVPEPSTVVLAAFGLIGLAVWVWRRR